MNEPQWRNPTDYDNQLIKRLLDTPFTGSDSILAQLEHCRVREFDNNGSIEFLIPIDSPLAQVEKRVAVEGVYTDSDGITAHVLLHVVSGVTKEIEIYKEDNSDVLEKSRVLGVRVQT